MTNQTDPAALVKAALEQAALKVAAESLNGKGDDMIIRDWAVDRIRALADDPEAVAEIVEQVKGENDG